MMGYIHLLRVYFSPFLSFLHSPITKNTESTGEIFGYRFHGFSHSKGKNDTTGNDDGI